jgi:hypothetical protein
VGGVQQLDPSRTLVHISTVNGQTLQGSALVGTLDFTPPSGPSAFVPLTLQNASAIKSGNIPIRSVETAAGRVAVIGVEPLLDAQPGPVLFLYGNPGATYQIESTTNLGSSWSPAWQVGLTNLYQPFLISPTDPQTFYRASVTNSTP